MPRSLHFTWFLASSLALHGLIIAAAMLLIKPEEAPPMLTTPVKLVNLPRKEVKKLPPIERPAPVPERPVLPKNVPSPQPRRFETSPNIKLPSTTPPSGIPEGSERGKADKGASDTGKGPLPFLTQNDIEKLARRGMPERKPGDNSVTLDTDEFKFISYNRWLKIKVESTLKYPELAAVSGLQGTLYIKFDIMKDGSVGNVELLKSSGYKILDDEALRAIRASAPFQPLPDDWDMDQYSIRAAVLFYLSEAYIR